MNETERTSEASNLEKYGTLTAWGNVLDIGKVTLRKMLKVEDGIRGRTHSGGLRIFYAESYVRERLRDLIEAKIAVWNERYQQLVAFINLQKRDPSTTANDDTEKLIALWYRRERTKMRDGQLSPEQLEKLQAIGAEPVTKREVQVSRWKDRFEEFKIFKEQHQRFPLRTSSDEVESELGRWLQQQTWRMRDKELRAERIAMLEALGVQAANPPKSWEDKYALLLTFLEQNEEMPSCTSEDEEEKALGFWVREQGVKLREQELTPEQEAKIRELGIKPTPRRDWEIRWETRYKALALFFEREQRSPSTKTGDEDEASLKKWLDAQQCKMRDGELTEEHEIKLRKLGIEPWRKRETPNKPWDERFIELESFMKQRATTPLGASSDELESSIGKWLETQRAKLRDGELTEERSQKLLNLGIQPSEKREEFDWEELFIQLQQFISQHNRTPFQNGESEEEKRLAFWIRKQRRMMQAGSLDTNHLARLQSIGIEFTANILNGVGIGIIDGVEAVGLQRYSEFTLGTSGNTVIDAVRITGLKPIGRAQSRGAIVDVYKRSEIDSLEIVQTVLKAKNNKVDDKGCISIGDEEGIGISRYADKVLGTTISALEKAITEANLQPIGKALSGLKYVDVYRKSEVDALELSKNSLAAKGNIVSKEGICSIEQGEGISVVRYASHIGISNKSLQQAIEGAKLLPIGMGRSHKTIVKLYKKSEVDALEIVKLAAAAAKAKPDKNGIIDVNGETGVVISKYADEVLGVTYGTVAKAIADAELKPIGHAAGKNGFSDIYRKSEIDALDIVVRIQASKGNSPNKEGIVMIGEQDCIAIIGYAGFLEITGTTLSKAIADTGLQAIGYARSGKKVVEAYQKSEVDALETVKLALAAKGKNVDSNGIIDMNGVPGISIDKYSKFLGIAYETLQRPIVRAGLQPIGHAKSSKIIVEVYRKEDVDVLEQVQKALRKKFHSEEPTDTNS